MRRICAASTVSSSSAARALAYLVHLLEELPKATTADALEMLLPWAVKPLLNLPRHHRDRACNASIFSFHLKITPRSTPWRTDVASKRWSVESDGAPDSPVGSHPDAGLGDDEEFTITSNEAFVAASAAHCQQCGADIEVICIHCRSGTVSGAATPVPVPDKGPSGMSLEKIMYFLRDKA